MQAFSIYKQLVLVWIHRLTGYLLIAGAAIIGSLSLWHLAGAELHSVAETWFGFDVATNAFVFWLHSNPGLAVITCIVVAIFGSKLTTDAHPLIAGLTPEFVAEQRSRAVRFEMQDLLAALKESLNELTFVGEGASGVLSYRKKLLARISELLAAIAEFNQDEAKLLDPDEITRTKGLVTYVHNKNVVAMEDLKSIELLVSDLETATLLCENASVEVTVRSQQLHERLGTCISRAQKVYSELPSDQQDRDILSVIPLSKGVMVGE